MTTCPNCGDTLPPGSSDCPRCTTQAFPAARASLEAPEISGYDIVNRLGEGGMGAVYTAIERALGRRVAVKVIAGKLASDQQARARFMREARALATVEHANVVRVYAFGEVDGSPYLAMEYIDGRTLAEHIRRQGRLPVEEALQITRQILAALEAAWERGIVHRDVKPSNVLLDKRNRAHVADFGLAKATQMADDPVLTQSGHVIGTPYYVSPEQAQGLATDFRSDIYSCGILLYEMLTGERPFDGTTPVAIMAKHLHDPLPAIRSKRPDVPGRVVRLIESMTEKQPERRPQSYPELIATVESLLGITPARPIAATQTFSTVPVARLGDYRKPLLAIGTLALVVLGGSLAYYRPWSGAKPASPDTTNPRDGRLVVAVAPFYGPDDDSIREGRVMSALVERSIAAKLGADKVRVVGIDDTKTPLRTHDAARELGQRLGASVVVWGEAFALKNETEIQPYFTLIRPSGRSAKAARTPASESARSADLRSSDPISTLSEQSSAVVRMEAERPNQIELRKMSAEGVGEMVSLLAAVHAFYDDNNPNAALRFLDQAPPTREATRLRATALIALAQKDDTAGTATAAAKAAGNRDRAIALLRQLVASDAKDVRSAADLADILLMNGRFADAAVEYERLAASGQPYVTHYGIASKGTIYVRELYRSKNNTSGALAETAYLLAVSPADGVVQRRVRLPGMIRSFTPRPDGFSIEYAADKDESQMASVTFVNGHFDRPLILGGNLLLRMRGMKSGFTAAENFMGGFTGVIDRQDAHPKFGPTRESPAEESPNTFPDLERVLRQAAQRDPTQPWTLFFLGQALWAQGKKAEAEAVWQPLLTRDFGIQYIEYSWMAKYFDRLGQTAWADRLIQRALRERQKIAQPIQFSTLIERLINESFARMHPSDQKQDVDRTYRRLLQARQMSGVTEADHYAAAAWAGYFRRTGDSERARAEADFARMAAEHPFNFTAAATRADYALNILVAVTFGFLLAIVALLERSIRRARRKAAPLSWRDARRRITLSVPRPWTPVVLGLELATVVIVGLYALAGAHWASFALMGIAAAGALLLAHALVPFKALIAETQRGQRLALSMAFVILLIAAANVVRVFQEVGEIGTMPIGIADSLGHPAIVADLEARLKSDDTPSVRYVTAVANELGGNVQRAKQLYANLPHDARAQRALAALNTGRSSPTFPGVDEMYACYSARARRLWIRPEAWSGGFWTGGESTSPWTSVFALTLGTGLILLIAFPFVPPSKEPGGEPAPRTRGKRILSRAAYVAVPGLYDLERGSFARGVVMASLLGLALWVVAFSTQTAFGLSASGLGWGFDLVRSPGILTAIALPNILSGFPMPPQISPWDLTMAPPGASWFWGITLVAVALLLILHLQRIPSILRLYGDAPADAATTLISTGEPA